MFPEKCIKQRIDPVTYKVREMHLFPLLYTLLLLFLSSRHDNSFVFNTAHILLQQSFGTDTMAIVVVKGQTLTGFSLSPDHNSVLNIQSQFESSTSLKQQHIYRAINDT